MYGMKGFKRSYNNFSSRRIGRKSKHDLRWKKFCYKKSFKKKRKKKGRKRRLKPRSNTHPEFRSQNLDDSDFYECGESLFSSNFSLKGLQYLLLGVGLPMAASQAAEIEACKIMKDYIVQDPESENLAIVVPKESPYNPTGRDITCNYKEVQRGYTTGEAIATLSLPVIATVLVPSIVFMVCLHCCKRKKQSEGLYFGSDVEIEIETEEETSTVSESETTSSSTQTDSDVVSSATNTTTTASSDYTTTDSEVYQSGLENEEDKSDVSMDENFSDSESGYESVN